MCSLRDSNPLNGCRRRRRPTLVTLFSQSNAIIFVRRSPRNKLWAYALMSPILEYIFKSSFLVCLSSYTHFSSRLLLFIYKSQKMDIIEEEIVIVGAGIAGLATSLGLHRLGLRSLVLESSDSLRTTGFALTLWTNAWRALDALGIGDRLREKSLQIQGFRIYSVDSGNPTSEVSLVENYPNHEGRCVKRKELLAIMEKELPKGTIRYSSKIVSIEESGHFKVVQLADGCIVRTKVLIGCDGVNSLVAKWLGLEKPVDTGRSAVRGFVDYPEVHQFKPKLHGYFGGGIRLGFVPCDDKSLYWFCTIHQSVSNWHQEDMAQDPVKLKEFVLSKSAKIPNIPEEVSNFLERTKLDSISCAALKFRLPWDFLMKDIAKRGICVAGDALHPMTPDIGQGGCSALEDGVVLAKCIGVSFLRVPKRVVGDGEDDAEITEALDKGVENFGKARKWRSFALVTAAFLVGYIQESDNKIICFLREKFLSKHTFATMMKMADFDCGKLSSELLPQ